MSATTHIGTLRGRAFGLAKTRGFTGEDASQLLRDVAGVDSLTRLDLSGWQRLIKQLGGDASPVSHLDKPANVSEKQWNYLQVLRKQLRHDDTDFIRFCKHTTRLEHPRFLSVESARLLILGMKRAIDTRRG